MKPFWGEKSRKHRITLHDELVLVLDAVLDESTEEQDMSIICGLRDEIDQILAYDSGASKVQYPKSYHNGSFDKLGIWHDNISDAVDVRPHPVEWPDRDNDLPHEYVRKMIRFYDLAYRILKKAHELRIALEWGGMFKSFFDGPHFQRKRW